MTRLILFLSLASVVLLQCSAAVHKRRHKPNHESNTQTFNVKNGKIGENSVEGESEKYISVLTSDKTSKYYVKQHEFYDEIKLVSCPDDECPSGQQCRLDAQGQKYCECAIPSYCTPGLKLVCGSDGELYSSHCELHRRACERKSRVHTISDTSWCLLHQKQPIIDSSEQTEKHVMSKKKDLTFQHSTAGTWHSDASPSSGCDQKHFEEFKTEVLLFHCNRIGFLFCRDKVKDVSHLNSLVMATFEYYDRDVNHELSVEELAYSQNADHLEKLAHVCSLTDFLAYSSGPLNSKQFWQLFDVKPSSQEERPSIQYGGLPQELQEVRVVANGMNSIQLNCSLPEVDGLVWLRNGLSLAEHRDQFVMMSSRELVIPAANLRYTGNYSCYDKSRPADRQHISLTVLTKPIVKTEKVGKVVAGVTTSLRCHASGIPDPIVSWNVGHYELPDDPKRYSWNNENSTVDILSPDVGLDTSAYHCVAKSEAGWTHADVDVQVEITADTQSVEYLPGGEYVIFHNDGYTVYKSYDCFTSHFITRDSADYIRRLPAGVSTASQMCPEGSSCDWDSAVNVKNKFIYVTQPSLKRILIINIHNNYRPDQVIPLMYSPVSLHYIAAVDEIWSLVGQQSEFQRLVVMRNASIFTSHTMETFLPYLTIFDSINHVFVPPSSNPYNTMMRFTYTTHHEQKGLNKVDIVSMTLDSELNLQEWHCLPYKVEFLTIGGLAVVQCKSDSELWKSRLLIIDTVTNGVLYSLPNGAVYSSPDSKYIVTLTNKDHLRVYQLSDNGTLSFTYELWTRMDVGHVTFMPSKYSRGYDVAILSTDQNSLEFIDLKTRKIEMVEGLLTGRSGTNSTPDVGPLVSTSGEFGETILVPSRGAMFTVDKRWHHISCQWMHLHNATLTTWVDEM